VQEKGNQDPKTNPGRRQVRMTSNSSPEKWPKRITSRANRKPTQSVCEPIQKRGYDRWAKGAKHPVWGKGQKKVQFREDKQINTQHP